MVLPADSTGRCTVWQVPHNSELMMFTLCAGSIPIAFFIGLIFGCSNGPYSRSGGPTRKLPVNVLANLVEARIEHGLTLVHALVLRIAMNGRR